MLTSMLGVALIYFAANEAVVIKPPQKGEIYYEHPTQPVSLRERNLVVKPVSEFRYHNVTRQAYDYSCGSVSYTHLTLPTKA